MLGFIRGDRSAKKNAQEQPKKQISTQSLVEGLCRAACRVKFGHLTPEAAKKSLVSHIQGGKLDSVVADSLLKILIFVAKEGFSENLVDFAYKIGVISADSSTLFMLWEKLLSSTLIKEKKLRIAICTILVSLVRRACLDQLEIPQSLFSKHEILFRGMILENAPEFRCCALQALENFQEGLIPLFLHCLQDPHHSVRVAAIKFIEIPPPESKECNMVYEQLANRASDTNQVVRSQVFLKLQTHEETLPVEIKSRLLRLGGVDKVASVRNSALKMFKKWAKTDVSQLIDGFLEKLDDLSFMEPILTTYLKTYNMTKLMERQVTLKPSELFIVRVYLANVTGTEERFTSDLVKLMSYCRELLNLDKEQAAIEEHAAQTPDEFMDAIEDDGTGLYCYTQKEHDELVGIYTSTRLKTIALSHLFTILHYVDMVEVRHAEVTIDTCSNALQSAPYHNSIESCMSSLESMGNEMRPANWLKNDFIYPCVSLVRKAIDRISKSDRVLNPNTEFTKKILLIISDIKDPFGGTGSTDEKFNVDDMSSADLTKYSDKLASKIKNKSEQLNDLKSTKVSTNDQKQALSNEINQVEESIQKMSKQLSQLRTEVKNRWNRSVRVLDAFLMLSKSNSKIDSSLCDFPSVLLLPALEFFATRAPEWAEYDFSDQLCEIIISKCLGNWCLLCGTKDESLHQIKAFTAALDGSLKALWEYLSSLSDLHNSMDLKIFQTKSTSNTWVDMNYIFSHYELEEKLSQLDKSALENYKTQVNKLDIQTLRCELYLSTLGDLISTNPYIYQTHETQHVLISYLWPMISGKYQTSKCVQSIAIKVACKIILTCLTQRLDDDSNPPFDDDLLNTIANNIRCLLEIAFLLPPSADHIVRDFKYIKTNSIATVSHSDKQYIIKMVSMFVLASSTHKKVLHKVVEQILTRTIHGVFVRKIPIKGITRLIAFLTQTCFFKSDPEMVAETFPNYMKWLLIVLIDKAPLLQADRSSFAKFVAEALDAYLNIKIGDSLTWQLGMEKDEKGTKDHLYNFVVLIEFIIADFKVRPFDPILKQLKTILTEHGVKFDDEKSNKDTFNRLVQSYDKNLQGGKGSRDLEITLATAESQVAPREGERKSTRIKEPKPGQAKAYDPEGESENDSDYSDYEGPRKKRTAKTQKGRKK